ncbi:cupin domain-containing protein [Arenibacter sp. N53]|uniref:cupin domain-containing protein n=1 Tax=Arenibacter TaxID=178469 RepID=UPI000CD3EDCA|nr:MULTISPECIES: cupin domain-containing protein [Arenibacter]MCM4153758.1 cupin domain-containing protein [Arenibacter sp. N53]
MENKKIFVILLLAIALFSCKPGVEKDQTVDWNAQTDLIFSKGVKITNNNFVGTAYVSMLVDADSLNQTYVGNVTFEPGARTNWHSHPSGQIILVVNGEGYYQEKGSPKRILRKGDAVKCPPNVLHWHGASSGSDFIQLAISSSEIGPTEWMDAVSDEEYRSNE